MSIQNPFDDKLFRQKPSTKKASFLKTKSLREKKPPAEVSPERPRKMRGSGRINNSKQLLDMMHTSKIQKPTTEAPRHTFTVSSKEVAKGQHTAAMLWLLREIPQAHYLELRYYTDTDLSIEITWACGGDDVRRSVDLELNENQIVPMGTTLLVMVAESARSLKHLKIFTGLERMEELNLGQVLSAFALAGHWSTTLESLEVHWSCVEEGTFSRLATYPVGLKDIKLDGCLLMAEAEVNDFLIQLPRLQSFQVVGSEQNDDRNSSMIDI
jgi:hypothetical protein